MSCSADLVNVPFADSKDVRRLFKSKQAIHESIDESTDGKHLKDLENSLLELRGALALFVGNKFKEAFDFCTAKQQAHADFSMPYIHGAAVLKFAYGLLTLEHKPIEAALEILKKDCEVCSSVRKKLSITESLSQLFWRPNYDEYTDVEANATICHAEAQMMQALLTFFSDQSIIGMIKGAMKIMTAKRTYNLCSEILKHKQNFLSTLVRQELECGVLTGIGTMNLILSHLPAKIMKVLSLAGFTGSYKLGVEQMKQAIGSTEAIRKDYATLIAIAYNLYMEHILGTGEGNLKWAKRLTEDVTERYPKSAFFKFFEGRLHALQGEPEQSIQVFQNCLNLQATWKPLHHICYWDICWSYAIQKDWLSAAKYAKIMQQECQWSPATNAYQYAVFMYHYMVENNKYEMEESIMQVMRSVPKLRIRWAGKTIPHEKFAVTQAAHFVAGRKSPLPAYELFYLWNIFYNSGGRSSLINPIHADIRKALSEFRKDSESTDWNHYCVLLLLNGVCLKYLNRHEEALDCFGIINANEKKLSSDYFYLAPHACLERGLTLWRTGDLSEAKQWIEKARDDYSDYLIEAMVQLRGHNALKQIANKEQLNVDNEMTSL